MYDKDFKNVYCTLFKSLYYTYSTKICKEKSWLLEDKVIKKREFMLYKNV